MTSLISIFTLVVTVSLPAMSQDSRSRSSFKNSYDPKPDNKPKASKVGKLVKKCPGPCKIVLFLGAVAAIGYNAYQSKDYPQYNYEDSKDALDFFKIRLAKYADAEKINFLSDIIKIGNGDTLATDKQKEVYLKQNFYARDYPDINKESTDDIDNTYFKNPKAFIVLLSTKDDAAQSVIERSNELRLFLYKYYYLNMLSEGVLDAYPAK